MKAGWGKLFNIAVKGNEMADQLASQGTKEEPAAAYSRLLDKETDIGVFHESQWVDSSIRKHMLTRNNKQYKKGLKDNLCESIIAKEEVAWKVAYTINHKPNHWDEANARIIHKQRR